MALLPRLLGGLFGALLVFACSRLELDRSEVRIQIPSASVLASRKTEAKEAKATSQSLTSYSQMCFYVNAVGPGLVSPRPRCEMQKGIFSAPALPGSQIVLSVPTGTDRVFEVYGYERANIDEACPRISEGIPSHVLKKFYLLGKSSPVELKDAEANVEILVQLPQSQNNLVAQLRLPADCFGSAGFGDFGGLKAATYSRQGNHFKIQSQISSIQGLEVKGTSFNIKARVRAQ